MPANLASKSTASVPPERSLGLDLTLHELAVGGDAVGRLADGRVVFVPGGAPEEQAEVALIQEHRSYARGQLVWVRVPSPQRVVPPCPLASGLTEKESGWAPVSATCGGCPLMHVARPAQLRAKQEWVVRALRHSGAEVLPILAPTPSLGYRVRARLLVREGQLSFAGARSHQGVAIAHCPVLDPALAAVLLGEGPAIAASLGEGGALSGLVGQRAFAPVVHLAVQLAPGGHSAAVRTWLQQLLAAGRIVGATLTGPALGPEDRRLAGTKQAGPALGPEEFGEPTVDLGDGVEVTGSLWASAEGFAQASAAGHSVLPRIVGELVGAPPAGDRWPRLIELYAGSGNLTRALRPLADHLVAIEGDAGAVTRLRRLLADSSLAWGRVDVVHEPVERALAVQLRQGARFDVAVLDPPRVGAREALAALSRLGVRRVVYVSCDAMTLGRDLVELRAAGLRPRSVQPLDSMPHTAQVECVAVLDAE